MPQDFMQDAFDNFRDRILPDLYDGFLMPGRGMREHQEWMLRTLYEKPSFEALAMILTFMVPPIAAIMRYVYTNTHFIPKESEPQSWLLLYPYYISFYAAVFELYSIFHDVLYRVARPFLPESKLKLVSSIGAGAGLLAIHQVAPVPSELLRHEWFTERLTLNPYWWVWPMVTRLAAMAGYEAPGAELAADAAQNAQNVTMYVPKLEL